MKIFLLFIVMVAIFLAGFGLGLPEDKRAFKEIWWGIPMMIALFSDGYLFGES